MGKLTKYQIVIGGNATDLSNRVSALIEEGWEPHGSMSFRQAGMAIDYMQPMILRAANEPALDTEL